MKYILQLNRPYWTPILHFKPLDNMQKIWQGFMYKRSVVPEEIKKSRNSQILKFLKKAPYF